MASLVTQQTRRCKAAEATEPATLFAKIDNPPKRVPMPKKIALAWPAVLALLMVAACSAPQPTDGAFRPVNPTTGTPQPGAANPS
jgi:hypothetical protein